MTIAWSGKKELPGAYHAIRRQHHGRDLSAISWRFNRRFVLGSMIEQRVYLACRMPPLRSRLATMADVHA